MGQRKCADCHRVYSRCWWLPSSSSGLTVEVCSVDFFQILPILRSESFAVLHHDVLELCSSLVLRLHGSFAGIVHVLQDILDRTLPADFRQKLFASWPFGKSLRCLAGHNMLADVHDTTMYFDDRIRSRCASPFSLSSLLRSRHLELDVRRHVCDVCGASKVIGIDAKTGFTTSVCSHATGDTAPFPLVGVQLQRGCCALPSLRKSVSVPTTCPPLPRSRRSSCPQNQSCACTPGG